MFKKVFISLIVLFTTSIVGIAQTTDLIISEYIEGSSTNKYIEIYNGTGASVNLADYELRLYSNGSATPSTTNVLSGTLANNSVIVYKNSAATIYGGAATVATAVNFNGDDAIALYKISTTSFVDIFGNIGCDPGSAWTSTNTTVNKTLVRNANVCSGITSDPTNTPCNFPTLATEWTQFAQNDVTHLGSHTNTCSIPCVAAAEPTTNSSSLTFPDTTCNSIDLSWTIGNGANRIIVVSTSPITGNPTDQTAYSASSVFGSGSTIAAGEYVVYNGSGNTLTVTGLAQSTTYYFAIFEYNGALPNCEENYLTTGMITGNATTFVCICPEITGMLIDACTGNEGYDEFFTFQNGNANLQIDSLTVNFPTVSIGPYCNSGCGANTWTTNPTYVTTLNDTAGCPGLFVEADPIPSNAEVIVFTGANPTYDFDFSGLCGTGPYYAIFANNTTDPTGRFGNYGACATRTLRVDFGYACSDTSSYDRCLLSNNDGDYVSVDIPGNPTYSNDGCTPTAILPITLLYFTGTPVRNTNLLKWQTSSEINNDFFTIERSENANEFYPIGTINGAGTSNVSNYYQFIDDSPDNGINYYRLKQTDFDGTYKYSPIIALNNKLDELNIYVNNNVFYIQSNTIDFSGKIEMYDMTGRKIIESVISSNTILNLSKYSKGFYIYRIISGNNNFSGKFNLQ